MILLSGREEPWPKYGEYRTSPSGEPFSGVKFRIDAVYQRTVAELSARGPLWMMFTPLAVDADPERMKEVLAKLRAKFPPRQFGELAAGLTVVAAKDKRHRGLRDGIVALLTKEDEMGGTLFQMGEARVLRLMYEKRLGRKLVETERDLVLERLLKVGVERLIDMGNELSAEALAAWLENPEAA